MSNDHPTGKSDEHTTGRPVSDEVEVAVLDGAGGGGHDPADPEYRNPGTWDEPRPDAPDDGPDGDGNDPADPEYRNPGTWDEPRPDGKAQRQ